MNAKSKIVVVGTGGLAREFIAWFGDRLDVVGFSTEHPDDAATWVSGKCYDNSVTPEIAGTNQCVVAVGAPKMKQHLHGLFKTNGWTFPTIIHSTATVAANVQLAEGVIISPHCVVGSDVTIGPLAYLNFQVGVGHDAVIGPYVQINPGAQVGGAASVQEGVLLGSNSALLQGVKIGAWSTVGLGAVCLGRVRAGITVVGNPAKRWCLTEAPLGPLR